MVSNRNQRRKLTNVHHPRVAAYVPVVSLGEIPTITERSLPEWLVTCILSQEAES